jgi:hypothetical protein
MQALPTRRAAWSVLVEAALSLPSLTVVDLQRVDVGLADLKRFTGGHGGSTDTRELPLVSVKLHV